MASALFLISLPWNCQCCRMEISKSLIQAITFQHRSAPWPLMITNCWASIITVSDRVKPSFVIFGTRHSDAQGWASECPDVKNYKWPLNPAWHRMLYSCTHMATVGVKGLITWSLGHSGYYFATCNSGLGFSQVWSLWPRPFVFLVIPVILCGCFNLFEFSLRFMPVSYFALRLMHILILLNIVDQKSLSSFISGDWETLLCNIVCHCKHCICIVHVCLLLACTA